MSVGRICIREVHTAEPGESVRAISRRMQQQGVGALVVIEGSRPVGIVTDRDVALRCVAEGRDPEATLVSDVMTAPALCVHEATPIETAIQLMSGVPMRRVVVTDGQERLVGILSLDDVLDLLLEEVEHIARLVRAQQPGAGG
jgi:CBS domain-containing protein